MNPVCTTSVPCGTQLPGSMQGSLLCQPHTHQKSRPMQIQAALFIHSDSGQRY